MKFLKQYREPKDWAQFFLNKNPFVEFQKFEHSRLYNLLKPVIFTEPKGIMLEGGAGLCKIGWEFSSVGWKVLCIEKEQALVTKMQIAIGSIEGITILVGDVKNLQRDKDIDVYVSPGVLEHYDFEEQTIILNEAYRVLKPKGLLVMIVPYINWWRQITWFPQMWKEEYKMGTGVPFYQYRYSKRAIKELLETQSFTVEKTELLGLHDIRFVPKSLENNKLLNHLFGSTIVVFARKPVEKIFVEGESYEL